MKVFGLIAWERGLAIKHSRSRRRAFSRSILANFTVGRQKQLVTVPARLSAHSAAKHGLTVSQPLFLLVVLQMSILGRTSVVNSWLDMLQS